MPRRMSCSKTRKQVEDRTKTVTRRFGTWKDLQPGDRLTLVDRVMGIPKGGQQTVLAEVEVVSNSQEPLSKLADYGPEEPAREGFSHLTCAELIAWMMAEFNVDSDATCQRIQWKYLDDIPPQSPETPVEPFSREYVIEWACPVCDVPMRYQGERQGYGWWACTNEDCEESGVIHAGGLMPELGTQLQLHDHLSHQDYRDWEWKARGVKFERD